MERFGDHGGPDLARRLNLPARTWYNYETGVTVPAEVLLAFIDETGANPKWLLNGDGPKFRHESEDASLDDLSPSELIRRSLARLAHDTQELGLDESFGDFVRIRLVSLTELGRSDLEEADSHGVVQVDRSWIANPGDTVASTVEDDSMSPILPMGSLIAVDFSTREFDDFEGRLVVARVGEQVFVRWFENSENQVILRPNRPGAFPLMRIEPRRSGQDTILGQVVWSWSSFLKG